jgi:hypothetical protein
VGTFIMLLGNITEAAYTSYIYVCVSVCRAGRSISYLHLTSLTLCTCAGSIFIVDYPGLVLCHLHIRHEHRSQPSHREV